MHTRLKMKTTTTTCCAARMLTGLSHSHPNRMKTGPLEWNISQKADMNPDDAMTTVAAD